MFRGSAPRSNDMETSRGDIEDSDSAQAFYSDEKEWYAIPRNGSSASPHTSTVGECIASAEHTQLATRSCVRARTQHLVQPKGGALRPIVRSRRGGGSPQQTCFTEPESLESAETHHVEDDVLKVT